MSTLVYMIFDSNENEIGQVYITQCPDAENLPEKLDNYGDEGYKFYQIISTVFEDVSKIEFLDIFDKEFKIPQTVVQIPWNLVTMTN
jgi:hypothetical protein